MFVDLNWLSDKNNDPSIHMMVIILFCLLQKLDTYLQNGMRYIYINISICK